jgi:hypothetical protein
MEETWRRVETGFGEGEYRLQIKCHGVGMHLFLEQVTVGIYFVYVYLKFSFNI